MVRRKATSGYRDRRGENSEHEIAWLQSIFSAQLLRSGVTVVSLNVYLAFPEAPASSARHDLLPSTPPSRAAIIGCPLSTSSMLRQLLTFPVFMCVYMLAPSFCLFFLYLC